MICLCFDAPKSLYPHLRALYKGCAGADAGTNPSTSSCPGYRGIHHLGVDEGAEAKRSGVGEPINALDRSNEMSAAEPANYP